MAEHMDDVKKNQDLEQALAPGSVPLQHVKTLSCCDSDPCGNESSRATVLCPESLQELAGIDYGVYDLTTGSISTPPTAYRIPGLPRHSKPLPFREYLLHYPGTDSEMLLQALEQAILKKERTEVEVFAGNIPESRIRHRCTFIPLLHEKTAVTKVHCLIQDISETKSISPNKQVRQGTAGLIAESIRDVLFRVSLPDGSYEHISQAVQDVTGYPPHLWYRNPFLLLEIILPAWRAKFERESRKFLHGCGPKDYTFPILHQQGDIRWIHLRTTLIRDEQGKVLAIEGIASDITEKKQEEMERKQLIRELKKALAEVKTLTGLLPICSFCKKVRDDSGYWQQIESYLTEHSELFFTHGLCPDCLRHHYPEYTVARSPANPDKQHVKQ
jgi:PAS domain S-box-containing protein